MSGQLHVPAALHPGKDSSVHIALETGWARMLWRRDILPQPEIQLRFLAHSIGGGGGAGFDTDWANVDLSYTTVANEIWKYEDETEYFFVHGQSYNPNNRHKPEYKCDRECLILGYGTDRLSRNVGKQLPTYAV